MWGGRSRDNGGSGNSNGDSSADWQQQEADPAGADFQDPFDSGAPGSASGTSSEWGGGGGATADGGVTDGWSNDSPGVGFDEEDGGGEGRQPQRSQPLPSPPTQPQRPMQGMNEEEVRQRLGMGLCVAEFLINGTQGAIIGSIFGAFTGAGRAYNAGARGTPLVKYVLVSARSSAFSFGLWIGAFRGAKCSFITARGKKDALNSFLAGFVAGALPALPTRNPRAIFFSALGSAGLMGTIESIEGFLSGGGDH